MTIEAILERLVVAAERQAKALENVALANLQTAGAILDAAERQAGELDPAFKQVIENDPPAQPSYAEQRKAEIQAEPEAPKPEAKPRGRPKKVKEEPAPVVEAPVVEDEVDPFADAPAVVEEKEEEITVPVLRDTMVALRNKVGKDKAYALLRDFGKGATVLPGSTAANDANGAGVLKPELFAVVVREARKLMA